MQLLSSHTIPGRIFCQASSPFNTAQHEELPVYASMRQRQFESTSLNLQCRFLPLLVVCCLLARSGLGGGSTGAVAPKARLY